MARAFFQDSNHKNFNNTQVKLLLNFRSMPFDYLSISWVTKFAYSRRFLPCVLSRGYREISHQALPW